MLNMWYLFTALLVVWIAIGSYSLWMGKKQGNLLKEVQRLKKLMAK
ncbi:MAG TPA: CcmD family protein [Spirochaetes bacterium]|nr:CcmD family protein [Spirochaetota bacterium]